MTITNKELALAIVKHLGCDAREIKDIQEWASVYFVVFKNRRAQFVSKKVGRYEAPESMPALMGTPNAIEWANKIRENTIAKLDRVEDAKILCFIASKKSASWWISGRSYGRNGSQYNMIFKSDLAYLAA